MKVGRNEPCPCESGRKHKKCCGKAVDRPPGHTVEEREGALKKVWDYADNVAISEMREAFVEFWGEDIERAAELDEDVGGMSLELFRSWFAFDLPGASGQLIVEDVLESVALEPAERTFLTSMRTTVMRIYEVKELVPGSSITLLDLVEGGVVTVAERTASRSLNRHDCVATRVIERGCSGKPEMEMGVLRLPPATRERVLSTIEEELEGLPPELRSGGLANMKTLTPIIAHEHWIELSFQPAIPQLQNTDGEELLITRTSYHADRPDEVERALDGAEEEGIERGEGDVWLWSGPSRDGSDVVLGSFTLKDDRLFVETNSLSRGERARALVERLAGDAIRHRHTEHSDMQRMMEEQLKQKRGEPSKAKPMVNAPEDAVAIAELFQQHYQKWVDQPVPALDDRSPREAAKIPALRRRLERILGDMEGQYERATERGEPAFDPSWLWETLGLREGETQRT